VLNHANSTENMLQLIFCKKTTFVQTVQPSAGSAKQTVAIDVALVVETWLKWRMHPARHADILMWRTRNATPAKMCALDAVDQEEKVRAGPATAMHAFTLNTMASVSMNVLQIRMQTRLPNNASNVRGLAMLHKGVQMVLAPRNATSANTQETKSLAIAFLGASPMKFFSQTPTPNCRSATLCAHLVRATDMSIPAANVQHATKNAVVCALVLNQTSALQPQVGNARTTV
jgi:hypothetical protein